MIISKVFEYLIAAIIVIMILAALFFGAAVLFGAFVGIVVLVAKLIGGMV